MTTEVTPYETRKKARASELCSLMSRAERKVPCSSSAPKPSTSPFQIQIPRPDISPDASVAHSTRYHPIMFEKLQVKGEIMRIREREKLVSYRYVAGSGAVAPLMNLCE